MVDDQRINSQSDLCMKNHRAKQFGISSVLFFMFFVLGGIAYDKNEWHFQSIGVLGFIALGSSIILFIKGLTAKN